MPKKPVSIPSKRPPVISVRPDHKLRYLVELAARHDQRPVANYIEWAISESFNRVALDDYFDRNGNHTLLHFNEISDKLWSPDEAGRLAKLAIYRPQLMDESELEVWTMISDTGLLDDAREGWNERIGDHKLNEEILINRICPILRDLWEGLLEAHAAGWNAQREWVAKTKEELQKKAASGNEAPQQEEDAPWDPDDIPF